MKRLVIVLSAFVFSCTPPDTEEAMPEVNSDATAAIVETISEEEKAINAAVIEAYDVLEYQAGTPHDMERLRAAFIENPVFMNFRFDSLEVMTLSDIEGSLQAMVESGELQLFQENEVGGITEYFGKVAHRISTYETYINSLDAPAERGVNSFQLIKLDGKWLVSSIIWDIERETLPIPEKYQ